MWKPETESMPREAVEALQLKRLRRLVRRLEQTVPFYRNRMRAGGVTARDVRTLEDARHLPFTTRSDLRDQYPLGLVAVPLDQVARFHATSGSRGKPTLVSYTAQDLRTWAEFAARMLYAAGARPGDVWYIASSYGLFSGGMGAHYGLERLGAAVVPASSGNTLRLVQLMADVRPAGIHCVPTYMLRIAEVAREAGIDPRDLGLRFGSYGGETWSEPLRHRIEEEFGLIAYDVYGLAECYGPGVAYECEERGGLHLSEDHFLFEVVDPATGQPVPDGQEGELIITTLTKQAMPLLRYRTGDLTRILPGECPCGRTFRRMARISGRSDDMLIIRGVNLYPSEVE
ncbi:MAG: phenylacetate--CoA ligase family protein, partial [Bacillota bacterium]